MEETILESVEVSQTTLLGKKWNFVKSFKNVLLIWKNLIEFSNLIPYSKVRNFIILKDYQLLIRLSHLLFIKLES